MLRAAVIVLSLLLSGAVHAQSSAPEVVAEADLEEIDNKYYEKETGALFTGMMTGYDKVADGYTIARLVDGVGNGLFEGFYDQAHTIKKWTVNYVNGKRQGENLWYYPDGTLSFRALLKDDALHGIRKCYHENGELWHIHHYKKDKEYGRRFTYLNDGTLSTKEDYKDNVRHGKYIAYNKDGATIHLIGYFKKDERVGTWREFDRNGKKVVRKVKYRNDEEVK